MLPAQSASLTSFNVIYMVLSSEVNSCCYNCQLDRSLNPQDKFLKRHLVL